jgi:tetratricopeptide (TPR) repeat protein
MLSFARIALFLLAALTVWGQGAAKPAEKKTDKAAAYYHYSLGHLYGELAAQYNNRGEYLNKAIDNFRQAMKADPEASFIAEELSDLYIQSGRLREAVTDAEEAIKQNPNDLNSRRILARIYTRLIGDSQQGKINEEMVRKATEQYQRIAERDPKDVETLLMLGRLYKVQQKSPEAEKVYKQALEQDPANEDALTGLAMVYADLGDNRQAADMLRRVAEKSPNARTLLQLASSYEQMREYALAAQTLKKALEMNPPNPAEVRRAMAQDLLMADQLDEALKSFEELVKEEPNDTFSWLRISQIHRQKKNNAKAWEAANKAKELSPGSLEVRFNEVALLEAEGKTTEGIKILKDLLDQTQRRNYNPGERANRVALYERLGVLYRSVDRTEEAVECFRQIAALDADLAARASAQAVETYRQAKEYTKADQESAAALQKHPQDRTLQLVRSNLLADLGRTEEAIAITKKMLTGRDDRDAYVTLAQLYEKAKKFDDMAKAIDQAEKLSSTKEDRTGVQFLRGAMYEKQKKFDLAEAEFRKVLSVDAENAAALNYLGYMLVDRNVRVQEGFDMIKKALDQEPGNGAYLDSLGWAYFRLNKLEEAESYLKRALERVPRDPTIHDHLADVYLKQGKLKDAIRAWERALKEWETGAPADQDKNEIARVQKKLESARVKVAKER